MAAERLTAAPTLYGADQLDHHVRMALAICKHAGSSAQLVWHPCASTGQHHVFTRKLRSCLAL